MITIPEGMDFDGIEGMRKVLTGVKERNRKGRKRRFVVPPGLVRGKYKEDRSWDYSAAREGAPPKKFRVAEMDIVEKPSKRSFVRINNADSIDMPGGARNVKVVGPDMIAPAGEDPDFDRVSPKYKILEPMPEEIMAEDNVQILTQAQEFDAETFEEDVPGFDSDKSYFRNKPTGVLRQRFPARSEMQAPDKIIYDNPSNERPSWAEREEVHEEYAEEGEEQLHEKYADDEDQEMAMGTLRVSDDSTFEDVGQWDVIASVAATALTAAATGYSAYSQIKAAKEAKSAAKKQAAADAAASAAAFEQQFNQNVAARYGAPAPVPGAPYPPSYAPYSTGTDWTKVALYAGGGVILAGVAYLIFKK